MADMVTVKVHGTTRAEIEGAARAAGAEYFGVPIEQTYLGTVISTKRNGRSKFYDASVEVFDEPGTFTKPSKAEVQVKEPDILETARGIQERIDRAFGRAPMVGGEYVDGKD